MKKNKHIFLLAILLISLTISGIIISNNINLPNLFIKDGVLLIDRVASYPLSFMENNDLKQENEKLTKEIEQLREYQYENEELNQEIKKLKETLDINNLLSDKQYINASTINRNLGYWLEKLTIDKGTNDGIENNMAVLSNGVLVGITSNVSPLNSDVLLFSNAKFPMNVSVKIIFDDQEIYGILNSYNDNLYSIIGVVDNVTIPPQAKVMTTGLGNIFPSGLFIGYVKEVVTDNFDLAPLVKVTPATSFDNISYVTVIKREEK